MLKKRIGFILLFSLLLTLRVAAAAPAIISAADVSGKAGDVVTVDVTVASNLGLAAWLFDVEWDCSALEPVEDQISVGSTFRSGSFLYSVNSESMLRTAWFSTKNVSGDGTLFSVPFRIKPGASGVYMIKLTCSQENTINSDEETVTISVSNGSITVTDGGESATESSAEAPVRQQIPVPSFADVSQTDYFYAPVLWAAESGITNGTTADRFSPEGGCTRAQAVTFLWRATGKPEPIAEKTPFTDVFADAYYYKAVLWATENGITSGTSAAAFSPDAPVTRAQAVTFLWRSAGRAYTPRTVPFSDVAEHAYYADAVSWAVQRGVTNGISNMAFGPELPCTRAQIVTFLYRYFAA